MFGITSASEKYQQVIQKVLKYCSGMADISDEIIIYGPNNILLSNRLWLWYSEIFHEHKI